MRGVHIFEKPCYREIRVMRGRAMRGLPVSKITNIFLKTNLPEPFKAQSVNQLKEGLPEGLSDVVRERGQRWTMEDRLMATM